MRLFIRLRSSSALPMCILFFFFFSSRRRHTRLVSDWSSDVCSSDLACPQGSRILAVEPPLARWWLRGKRTKKAEIGRASCRERVEISGVGGSLEKKEVDVGERR